MFVLKTVLMALFSLVLLFALAKLMGSKQLSQLSFFDYITGITIGSIAAEMAINVTQDWKTPAIAMIVYGVIPWAISIVTDHSIRARWLFEGKPTVLMQKGKLIRKNFKKGKMDLSEFLALARVAGYYDITQIDTAMQEHNGSISFLPKAPYRPVQPEDTKLKVSPALVVHSVILDGTIIHQALTDIHKDEQWLMEQLKKNGYAQPGQIFLAVADDNAQLTLFGKY